MVYLYPIIRGWAVQKNDGEISVVKSVKHTIPRKWDTETIEAVEIEGTPLSYRFFSNCDMEIERNVAIIK